MERRCAEEKIEGIISRNYAPRDDGDIQKGERAFYTHENALLIDTYRALIDEVVDNDALKKFFLAPLVTEASIHVNTSGVFKGFYKDKNTGIGCFGAAGRNAPTLRQSIASIVAHNQYDKSATDAFIDRLYVEWFYSENAIKSEAAKSELHDIEQTLLAEHFRILNIQENRHPLSEKTKTALKSLRKQSKNMNFLT